MNEKTYLIIKSWLMAGVTLLILCILTESGAADEYKSAQQKADSMAGIFKIEIPFEGTFDSTTTLEDYLLIAMMRNLNLKSAYYNWVSELKKSDYAGSLPDPMFSYGHFIENVETRVGPQQQRFSLKQSFPWFGTLGARKDMAFASSQATFQKFESERLKIFYQVKSAYYDFYYLGKDLKITRANYELLTFWEAVARSKYKVGMEQYPDLIKAQVELGKLEDRLESLQDQIDPAAARLRALLDLTDSTDLPVPASIEIEERQLDVDSIIKTVKNNNPNLKAMTHIIEREEAGIRLASKLSLPSFSIGIDYIQTGDAINPDLPESGKDPLILGAGISVPIWFGKNNARKSEAKARQMAASYNMHNARNQLVAITEKVLFEYSDALRKMKLYRDGLVPKAEQSLNASFASYQAGETDFLNVLDAQRQLLDFELTVAREKTRLAKKRAELEMISGTEIINFFIE